MKVTMSIRSDQLNVEDLRALLQAVRDCEITTFPDKEIHVFVEVSELDMAECTKILASTKPPYKHGPAIFKFRDTEKP